MLQAELKILAGKHQGKAIPLTSKKFLVGREQDCQLRPNSELVSRHHCVFSIDDFAVRLRDLGSTNGTFVNGKAIRGEVVLKPGDHVTIGRLEVELTVMTGATARAKAAAAEVPAVSAPSAADASRETIEFSGVGSSNPTDGETSYEMPTFIQNPPAQQPSLYGMDTAVLNDQDSAVMSPAPIPQQFQVPPQQPMPGPAAYPPGMYPPSGYGMPYPAAGYPQAPYPGQPYPMPGYPMQPMYGMPGYPAPMAPAPAPAAEPATAGKSKPTAGELPVRLPPPDQTGAVDAPPPAPAAAAPAGTPDKPSNTAADIIKQYLNRRG
jgi:predicted component of type VI protein secretion system